MSSKQLILFKGVDVKRLDSVLTEVCYSIYAMKTFAMRVDTSIGKNEAFKTILTVAEDLADLCNELSDISFKYMGYTQDMWDKTTKYDPYYAALEPRSLANLIEIASNYKSSTKGLLLRLEACLREASIPVPYHLEQINRKLEKIYNLLKNESTKL